MVKGFVLKSKALKIKVVKDLSPKNVNSE